MHRVRLNEWFGKYGPTLKTGTGARVFDALVGLLTEIKREDDHAAIMTVVDTVQDANGTQWPIVEIDMPNQGVSIWIVAGKDQLTCSFQLPEPLSKLPKGSYSVRLTDKDRAGLIGYGGSVAPSFPELDRSGMMEFTIGTCWISASITMLAAVA